MPTPVAISALAALLAGALFPAWQGAPWAAITGAAIAAGAPLLFLLAFQRRPVRLDGHPLIISIISGLGCVVVMIAETRFGPTRGWPLIVSLLALAVWMVWQRRQRRESRPRQR